MTMKPDKMSDSQLNAEIAVICGWESGRNKDVFSGQVSRIGRHTRQSFVSTAWRRTGEPWQASAPDYTGDLNAIYEAENTLFAGPDLRDAYVDHLMLATGLDQADIWHASARQRAEAFLATMGGTKAARKEVEAEG